jgi:hypothetical protein
LILNRPEYLQQTCRQEHDERNARHAAGDLSDVPQFPPDDVMRAMVADAVLNGNIFISKAKAKRVFGN